jgi:hypothetical protein
MRRRRPTPEDIVRDVINRMFEIAGHSTCYEDVVGRQDQWYLEWTMTEEQDRAWRIWMIDYFKKECKYVPKIAEREAAMCSLMWGLKLDKNG